MSNADPCRPFRNDLNQPNLVGITPLTANTDFPYTFTDGSYFAQCNKPALAAAVTVKLPANRWDGRVCIVKDSKGDAGANNITVDGNGVNIDGGATDTIATNYGCRWYRYDGALGRWETIAKV